MLSKWGLNILVLSYVLTLALVSCIKVKDDEFLVITVASNETDGYKRFMKSAEVNGLQVKTLGLHQPWLGGNMQSPGGGYKVNLLKEALNEMEIADDLIILFTDSYDVIIDGSTNEILERFNSFDAKIVFGAEKFCWPDTSLYNKYPEVGSGYRFLNSGGFIGYAKHIKSFIGKKSIKNEDDDQLFYALLFLDEALRNEFKVVLDTLAQLFQNLNGNVDEVKLNLDSEFVHLTNTKFNTHPIIIHGNGRSKLDLNSFGNYLAKAWTKPIGCTRCNLVDHLESLRPDQYPSVLISVFIDKPSAFLEEFLNKIANFNYPAKKISMFLYNNQEYHGALFENYIHIFKKMFKKVKFVAHNSTMGSQEARNQAVELGLTREADYYFYVDSDAQLDNPNILRYLVNRNESIIAPLLVRPFKAWSNFWGALNSDGFYTRSFDYMDIVNGDQAGKGIWNVPYITNCYLINMSVIKNYKIKTVYTLDTLDPDMAFCTNLRNRDIHMKIDSTQDYGHLVNSENFDPQKTNPDLYELVRNPLDWDLRYIHADYQHSLLPETVNAQPCPDVFWFPIVTDRFCDEFVQIMEAFGQWSDGSNNDKRLETGYEAVPTRDIHMKQVGLAGVWSEFLRKYVTPLQEREFIGYHNEPPKAPMSFVVRYRPDEQPSLRPHHDSSTYTINIALNTVGVDYEGGGCRFIRYDCDVTTTRKGWMFMHPGRLTHYHEGLLVTKGTRYIMISFVDP
uniref:procollagen-lysine 5-dioxygenase n=1 Tax=Cacopsylla melanoneura TaxID=428564 RepID=A0A8D8WHN7_9HEMI